MTTCSFCDADMTEDMCYECGASQSEFDHWAEIDNEAQRLADVATDYFTGNRKENK